MTPTQVIRNILEIFSRSEPGQPSPLLEKIVRLQSAATLAHRAVRGQAPQTAPAPPRIPAEPAGALAGANDDSRYMPKG